MACINDMKRAWRHRVTVTNVDRVKDGNVLVME